MGPRAACTLHGVQQNGDRFGTGGGAKLRPCVRRLRKPEQNKGARETPPVLCLENMMSGHWQGICDACEKDTEITVIDYAHPEDNGQPMIYCKSCAIAACHACYQTELSMEVD